MGVGWENESEVWESGDGSETGSLMKKKKLTTGIGASLTLDSGMKRRATFKHTHYN